MVALLVVICGLLLAGGGGGGAIASDELADEKTSSTCRIVEEEGIEGTGGISSEEGAVCNELERDKARRLSRTLPDPMNCLRKVFAFERIDV